MSQQVCVLCVPRDREFADELCDALERADLRPWALHREPTVVLAIRSLLDGVVEASAAVIILLSEASVGSPLIWVATQAASATDTPIIVVPMHDVVIPDELGDAFRAGDPGMSAGERAAVIAEHLAKAEEDLIRTQTSGIKRDRGTRVEVAIVDPSGASWQGVPLPRSALVAHVVAALSDKLRVPAELHELVHERTGRLLPGELTLAEAGVEDGDVLMLELQVAAGGGSLSEPPIQSSSTRNRPAGYLDFPLEPVQVTIMDVTGNKEQRATLPADAAVGPMIAKLVRMMGLPVDGPDGQPMGYNLHHKRSGRQLMGEQTLYQAGVADGDVLRLQPEITAGGGPPALLQREELRVSAYHPREVVAGAVNQLAAYAHLAHTDAEVMAHALKTLDLPPEDLRGVSAPAAVPVSRDAELIVLPQVEGLSFSPRQQALSLWEDWQAALFRFRASPDRTGTACNGSVGFYVGGLLIADVLVSIFVRDPQAEVLLPERPVRAEATPYRRVFPSHSHQDLEIVRACERYAAMSGDEYLRDVRALRSGEEWSPRLLELINEADVFQLFWSPNAAQSPYVEKEWQHALGQRRPHFVRPFYWRKPMPDPPAELAHIHFAYVELAAGSE
ncbi:MAG TPA: TIR domain-containing protein [Armatimonadota bacterium]|nr:TIR domain-containing protein [Armatimonadota bacterium]